MSVNSTPQLDGSEKRVSPNLEQEAIDALRSKQIGNMTILQVKEKVFE